MSDNVRNVRLPEEIVTVEPGTTYEMMFSPAHRCRIVGMLPVERVDYGAFELVSVFAGAVRQLPAPVPLHHMLTRPLSSGYRTDAIEPFPAGGATIAVRNTSDRAQPFAIELLVQEAIVRRGGN